MITEDRALHWNDDEIKIIEPAKDWYEAVELYRAAFPDSPRNRGGIRKKWWEMNRKKPATARQPQKEYIITESDCIIMEGWGKFPKYWIKYLRSRPHTSPPAPAPDEIYRIESCDAGMGETEHRVFLGGDYICQCPDRPTAQIIVDALVFASRTHTTMP